MQSPKDSKEVIEFTVLFRKLQHRIDDDPADLEQLAADDDGLKSLCINLDIVAGILSMRERGQRELFARPVDKKFIEAWRDYEDRYAASLSRIFLSDLGLISDYSPVERRSNFEARWELADDYAKDQIKLIDDVIEFANDQINQDWREFPEGLPERIEEAASAWKSMGSEVGFDLQGSIRRRQLVPFMLIPRHVSQKYGESEQLSLFNYLKEAHDAFIFGAPFAALALMRSVLEIVLRDHYHADGGEKNDLIERIKRCENLPRNVRKESLHRMRMFANDVLHSDKEKNRIPIDLEREILYLLNVMRSLIEGAPS